MTGRNASTLAALTLSLLTACAPFTDADIAPLWQGFDIHWTYNHRVNRVGSWVDGRELLDSAGISWGFEAWSSAASGSGEDRAAVRTHWAALSVPGVGFLQVSDSVRITDLDYSGAQTDFETRVPLTGALNRFRGREQYAAVLNGFDLLSITDADKLGRFELGVTGAHYDARAKELVVSWSARLALGCTSLECYLVGEPDGVDYRLEPRFLVLVSEGELNLVEGSEDWAEGWTDAEPNTHRPADLVLSGAEGSLWASGIPAIRGFAASMVGEAGDDSDGDMHYLRWTAALTDPVYDADSGSARSTATLFLSNWDEDMWTQRPWGDVPRGFGYAQTGAASMTLDWALLQFEQRAEVLAGSARPEMLIPVTDTAVPPEPGEIHWPGAGASADTDAALARADITVR